MPKPEELLVRCFASVFPKLSEAQIRSASNSSVEEWDSLAAVTLVALLEEEISVKIDLQDLNMLSSFESIRDYVERQLAER